MRSLISGEEKNRDSSPISTTIHSKELIAKQLGQISVATGRTRPVPILLGRTHWSGTTSGTQDSVEIREESRNNGVGSSAWTSTSTSRRQRGLFGDLSDQNNAAPPQSIATERFPLPLRLDARERGSTLA